MRTPLIAILFLLFNALYVCSTPLPLLLDLPKNDLPLNLKDHIDAERLHEANRIANLQIDAMHKVLQNPSQKKNKKILRQTFGKDFDYNAIKKHVDNLKTGTVKVSEVNSPAMPKDIRAKTQNGGTHLASIRFGPDYHNSQKMSDHGRAGTLIHEASHALFGTKDFFSKETKESIPKSKYHSNSGLSGYMAGKDYHDLKKNSFSEMHKNADSWKAFGYHALNGKPHPHLNRHFLKPLPTVPPATGSPSPHRGASNGGSKSPTANSSQRIGSHSPSRGRNPQRASSSGRSKSPAARSPQRKGRSHGPQRSASRGRSPAKG